MGYAGEMAYLTRNLDKRARPDLLVPGARSVICVAAKYHQPVPTPHPGLHGQIASYARSEDYHDVLRQRLSALWEFVQAQAPGTSGRYYVDTGPVLERELAQRAGLGWCGKNTCLINKRSGSFFFLAEIIADLELEFDEPATGHCGTCTRCLEACPTGALVEPNLLDSRRCIAYLTIELKGAIPRTLRPLLGNWIFGCDICQEVCPWNRRALPAGEPGFAGGSGLEMPDLIELLGLDQAAFSSRFRGSPIKRAKRRGLLRNVAVALGNCGDLAAVPALALALADPEPLVRGHAAWALGRLGGETARQALRQRTMAETDADTQEEIGLALIDLAPA
jgi:epoxyqueuosine reductase